MPEHLYFILIRLHSGPLSADSQNITGDCRIIAAQVFKSGDDVEAWVSGIVK